MAQFDEEFSTSPTSTTSPVTLAATTSSDVNNPSTQSKSPQGTVSPLTNGNSAPPLNPRSCTICRKRKVRCDKKHPCANCNKAGVECIFPGPGRAPRRSRKPADSELLARLRRLEGVVQNLGKGLDEDGDTAGVEAEVEPARPEQVEGVERKECGPRHDGTSIFGLHSSNGNKEPTEMIKEFGRLKVEGGRSRYISNKFWVSLSEEVAEMRDILSDPTDDEDDYPSPGSGSGSGSGASAIHQGFIFNFSSIANSLREFHPPPNQIAIYWGIFKENVDPLIKVFHRPTTEKLVTEAAQDLDHISKPMEVMMFTIYFAVITSMSENECITSLGVERQPTLEKYRFGFEQAMARATFLSTQELVVLQSFTLFLTCVRRFDDSRYAWTLTGLIIRIAQSLGVHRDGQRFGLRPFETEMRRRLWWQICSLDVRASEDHGSDPSIAEQSFDTKFPLNINDEDIYPEMEEPPQEREGRTEMLFDLIRYTVSTTVRRLSYAPPGAGPCRKRSSSVTLEDKENLIEELNRYLGDKYLKYCDTSVPLDWVAATVSRLIMAKMWLIVHHPFQREDGGAGLPEETKNRLFSTSVEVIEFSHLLETEKTTLKWGWLFRTYVQWHAVAFVLSQLCIRTSGLEVDKAWVAIDSVFDEWGGVVAASKRGILWKPLRKLMVRAKAARARELEKQRRFPLDGSIGPAPGSCPNSMTVASEPSVLLNGNNVNPNGVSSVPPGFSTFDTTLPMTENNISPYPFDTVPDPSVGMPPLLPLDINNNVSMDQWTYVDDPLASSSAIPADDGINWVGWDDMVKDFRMEVEDGQGVERGAGAGGVINWW